MERQGCLEKDTEAIIVEKLILAFEEGRLDI